MSSVIVGAARGVAATSSRRPSSPAGGLAKRAEDHGMAVAVRHPAAAASYLDTRARGPVPAPRAATA